MRNKIKKTILPLLVMAFAIGGAFATTTGGNNMDSAPVLGYIDAEEPCQLIVECSDTGTVICTNSLGQDAFGKENPTSNTCNVEVYERMP